MDIPEKVIAASKGLGTKVVFEHHLNGYDVFSVFTPSETEPPSPTGLPILILFKDDVTKVVDGIEALEWL